MPAPSPPFWPFNTAGREVAAAEGRAIAITIQPELARGSIPTVKVHSFGNQPPLPLTIYREGQSSPSISRAMANIRVEASALAVEIAPFPPTQASARTRPTRAASTVPGRPP